MIKFKNLNEFDIKYKFMKENRQEYLESLDKLYSYFNCALNDDDLIANYKNSIDKIIRNCE